MDMTMLISCGSVALIVAPLTVQYHIGWGMSMYIGVVVGAAVGIAKLVDK